MIRTLSALFAAGLLALALLFLGAYTDTARLSRVLPSRMLAPLLTSSVKDARASDIPPERLKEASGLPAAAVDSDKFFSELFANSGASDTAPASAKSGTLRLFVSFSMPKASLERLARDAKDAGIVLTFAGVPKTDREDEEKKEGNTFAKPLPLLNPESLAAFEPLIALGASVELHPEAFRTWGVAEVPALLVTPPAAAVQDSVPFDEESRPAAKGTCAASVAEPSAPSVLVSGDVTLRHMLEAAQSEAPHLALEISPCLERLAGRE
jgi:type-F conjugative transfer system pilin assembly protein TrbC